MPTKKNKPARKTTPKRAAEMFNQSGKTNEKYDRLKQAKKPGWRQSEKTGNWYFENRANRSDKGALLGVSDIRNKFDAAAAQITARLSVLNSIAYNLRYEITIGSGREKTKYIRQINSALKSIDLIISRLEKVRMDVNKIF